MQEEEKKGQILTKRTLWVMAVLCTLGVLAYNTVLASCYEAPAEGVQWRRCYMDGEDFSGLSLEKAELRESSFTRATLHQTNLRHTDARRAKFIRTILTEAQFTNANLREADFTKANADGADFSGAILDRARFFEASLRGANFTGASMHATDLLKADVSGATWIDGTTICKEGSLGQCR